MKDQNGKLLIPTNLDDETKALYVEIMESIRESSKYARGALLNERGQKLWEEPLDEYEKRMKGIPTRKPSPPPPPSMRKYKSGWFGGETLVNQDEIDKWREGNLK